MSGEMQGQKAGQPFNPTWTWGSSASVRITNANAPGPAPQFARTVTTQLAQISLPEPAVCSVYFQAVVRSFHPTDVINTLTLNLLEGIGRVTVPRQVVYLAQPAITMPLEVTLPFVPVHALNVNIELDVQLNNAANSLVEVDCHFILSPLTRIPQKEQLLAFGMALPGEADSLDDEMVAELETEGPTVQAAVLETMRVEGQEGDELEGDDGPDELEGVARHPAWLLDLVEALAERLQRNPTRDELRAAIARRQGRRRRRLVRLAR
jgi:hypothetical protein